MNFPLKFGNEIKVVRKINESEFSSIHCEMISQVKYHEGHLSLPDRGWSTALLGAGEEKAVFVVCDPENRVFALEVIDQRTYLNGRFVGGDYFLSAVAPHLQNVKYSSRALVGLTFSGLVKAREYVYGYEWARFQYAPSKPGAFDILLTDWLKSFLTPQFNDYKAQYKDVHDRNIMFEIREKSKKGIPVIVKDWLGKTNFVRVGVQPIDVR